MGKIYRFLGLSVGVIKLINTSRGRPIALENDEIIEGPDVDGDSPV